MSSLVLFVTDEDELNGDDEDDEQTPLLLSTDGEDRWLTGFPLTLLFAVIESAFLSNNSPIVRAPIKC